MESKNKKCHIPFSSMINIGCMGVAWERCMTGALASIHRLHRCLLRLLGMLQYRRDVIMMITILFSISNKPHNWHIIIFTKKYQYMKDMHLLALVNTRCAMTSGNSQHVPASQLMIQCKHERNYAILCLETMKNLHIHVHGTV